MSGAVVVCDPPEQSSPAWARVLGSRCRIHLLKDCLNGDLIRSPIAAIVAGLLSCSTLVASDPALRLPSSVGLPEKSLAQKPLVRITLREEPRPPSWQGSLQSVTQQPP